MSNEQVQISKRFKIIKPVLNERMRRLIAAAEAMAIGHGGKTLVAKATGVSRRAITSGCKEIGNIYKQHIPSNNIRRKGAGRKRNTDKQPSLLQELEKLIDPFTRGDPESPLRWTRTTSGL